MSQALHTSSTGINAGQSQINVIANNVANINTVAFKSANMTFETLYSHNLSYGSAATKNGGGTNPKQIGLGVKIGGITRNFTNGSFVSTGRDLDTMISGSGFFVVQDSEGKQYFTRDGIFSIDSAGNLVTQSGMKVKGAKSVYSNASSDKTVKLPKNMLANIQGDEKLGDKTLEELNNASITTGVVVIRQGEHTIELPVGDGKTTVSDLIEGFNKAISKYEEEHGTDDDPLSLGISFEVNSDGTISYSGDIDDFGYEGTTSNFCGETGLTASKKQSNILNETVKLQEVVNYNDTRAITLSNVAIDENGIIIATYKDGSVLTQYIDDAQTLQWKYTTPEGVVITGDDVTAEGSTIQNSNFAIELATMINPEGMISVNNNLWEWGPDVGEIYYGIAGEMTFGAIESGGYEESNVDVAMELSNMISAQRMIQMNSRVFSTASSVMETLAYLGQ
ncbi:flagellar hook-basal body complex protein [bacterium]|nr:flagellar hook-basal body complex protein [bacterium]